MEEIIDRLISSGKIRVTDNILFRKKSECASLFGRNFTNILRGGVPHPADKKFNGIIFWQEGENDRWENLYIENSEGEILEFTE